MYKAKKLKTGKPIKKYKPGDIDWLEDSRQLFRDPEYRLHPILGHQVRSRHRYEPESSSFEERQLERKSSGFRQPKLTPFELNPEYKDKKESIHEDADLKGVKQYPLKLEYEPNYPEPDFSHVKSARLRHAVEALELVIGYDHTTNTHILYSPLAFNTRWDMASQVIWLRTIGMSPKRIEVKTGVKYDTVKNWLRTLNNQPLLAATKFDWAIRQIEGRPERMTQFSNIEAKHRPLEKIVEYEEKHGPTKKVIKYETRYR